MKFNIKFLFVLCLTGAFSLFMILSDSIFLGKNIVPFALNSSDTNKQVITEQLPNKSTGNIFNFKPEPELTKNSTADRRIYISMGLCWKQHTHLYEKSNFPYEEAAR